MSGRCTSATVTSTNSCRGFLKHYGYFIFHRKPTANARWGRCKNQRISIENIDFKAVQLLGFKKLQEVSRMPPRGSKSVQRPPKTLPKHYKTTPKPLQDASRRPKMLPRGSKMPHDSPKSFPKRLQDRQRAAPNALPRHIWEPEPAQTPKMAPKSRPRPPQDPPSTLLKSLLRS